MGKTVSDMCVVRTRTSEHTRHPLNAHIIPLDMHLGGAAHAHIIGLTYGSSGQPAHQRAQATTYRVNLRIKGPRPPPIGLTCAVTSARATTTTNQSNFARNSPPHISDFEITPLELQRLWAISKNDRVKLRATLAGKVTAVTLGPLYRPREPRPRVATTNSFTKNRRYHH